ncbi:MAG: hypothetical protein WC824_11820 [Bacteroidota bacterium]|jgi:hypothetical protein
MKHLEKLTRTEALAVARDILVAEIRSEGTYHVTTNERALRFFDLMSDLRKGILVEGEIPGGEDS